MNLGADVGDLIVSFLDFDDQRNAAKVCRAWRASVLGNRRFGILCRLFDKFVASPPSPDWRRFFSIAVQYGWSDVLPLACGLAAAGEGVHDCPTVEKYRRVSRLEEMWDWDPRSTWGVATAYSVDRAYYLLGIVKPVGTWPRLHVCCRRKRKREIDEIKSL